MTSNLGTLIVDGVEIPIHTLSPFTQTYETIGGFSTRRMMSGAARKQTNWEKLATSVSGGGTLPPGLAAVDFSSSYVLSCGAPRSVRAVSSTITIPARRSDVGFEPRGRALVGFGWVDTPVSMSGSDAVITPVAGAEQYEAIYYPILTVIGPPPTEEVGAAEGEFAWSLTAEEV